MIRLPAAIIAALGVLMAPDAARAPFLADHEQSPAGLPCQDDNGVIRCPPRVTPPWAAEMLTAPRQPEPDEMRHEEIMRALDRIESKIDSKR